MARLIKISFFILLISLPAKGQNTVAFNTMDSLTWNLYLRKDWNHLIKEGNRGLRNHIDFYYLRMRMGIAFYEKKNYASAIRHFQAVLKSKPDDPVALEYLYYTYLYLNRHADASLITKKFSDSLKKKLLEKNKSHLRFNLNHSYYYADTKKLITDYQNQDETDGSQTVPRYLNFTRFSLSHHLGRRLIFNHQAGYLNKHNYRFYQQDSITYVNANEIIHQYQYYLSGNIQVGKGFSINPAFHYLLLNIPSYSSVSQGQGFGQSSGTSISSSYLNNYVLALNFSKYFRKFHAGFTSTYANLNSLNQLHQSLGLTWYPVGNLNFYLHSGITLSSEFFEWNKLDDRCIFSQSVGIGLFDAVWIEVEGTAGEMRNYVSNQGAIVYNSPANTRIQLGSSVIIPLITAGMTITLRYYYFRNESSYITSVYDVYHAHIIDYHEHLISGGLSWKF